MIKRGKDHIRQFKAGRDKRGKDHIQKLDAARKNQQSIDKQKQGSSSVNYDSDSGSFRTQFKGLLLIAGLVCAHGIEMSDKIKSTNPKSSQKAEGRKIRDSKKHQRKYAEICQDSSLKTFNKPNITLGIARENLQPEACIGKQIESTEGQLRCSQETQMLKQFFNDSELSLSRDKLVQKRTKNAEHYSKWHEELTLSLHVNIAKEIRGGFLQNISYIQQIANQISQLKDKYFWAQPFYELNGGHCGEHNTNAAFNLLRYAQQHDVKIKIQFVEVLTSKKVNYIVDHIYLLINSNVGNILIQNNVHEVNSFLETIVKGKICDPWNRGLFKKVKDGFNSGFYGPHGNWDSLKITTINLDFEDFSKLSHSIKKIFCNELHAMGLDLSTPREACSLFKKKKEKDKVSQPKDKDKELEKEEATATPIGYKREL